MRSLSATEDRFPTPELGNPHYLIGGYGQVPVLAADPELRAALNELRLALARVGTVHPRVQEVHPMLIFAIVAPDVSQRPTGLDHDRHPVQLLVTGVEDVS
jgi:hypothetical protein